MKDKYFFKRLKLSLQPLFSELQLQYLIPIWIGIRRGFKLIRAQDNVITGHPKLRVLIQILFLGLFFIRFYYYTHD